MRVIAEMYSTASLSNIVGPAISTPSESYMTKEPWPEPPYAIRTLPLERVVAEISRVFALSNSVGSAIRLPSES